MEKGYSCEGSCRCGAVVMRVSGAPLITMACHCAGCRKMTSSAYSLSAAFPKDAFGLVRGDPIIGGARGATRHYFCPSCLTWMFTQPEGMDDIVNVRSVLLDDPRWTAPFIETWTSVRLPFASTSAGHGFPEFPAPADIGPLIAAFARRVQAEP